MTVGQNRNGHDGHQSRPMCGGRKRDGSGSTCTQRAGWGTDHVGVGSCRLHGGNTPDHRKSAGREEARQAVVAYGLPRDIPADIALLEEVARTAGHVQALAVMVAELPREDLAWGVAEQTTRRIVLGGEDGNDGAEGEVVDTKRKAIPHALVGMYRDERRHLVEVCKTVAGLEIEERRERRAERQAAQFASVLRLLLADLGLTSEQQAMVPGALRTAVAALAAQPAA